MPETLDPTSSDADDDSARQILRAGESSGRVLDAGSGARVGRAFSLVGVVLVVLAVVSGPLAWVLGPAAALMGHLGHRNGDRPLGMWVGVAGIVAIAVGVALGGLVS